MKQKSSKLKSSKAKSPHERGRAGLKPAETSPSRKKQGNRPQRPQNLVYGVHACLSVLANPARRIKAFYATPEALRRHQDGLDQALRMRKKHGQGNQISLTDIPSFEVSARDLDARLGDNDLVHQGLMLEVEPLEAPALEDLPSFQNQDAAGLLLVLDQVSDPHNVGAILRSAAVFGADAIIVQDRHSPDMTPSLIKIACGGTEHVPLIRVTNIARTLDQLNEQAFLTIGLAAEGETELATFFASRGAAPSDSTGTPDKRIALVLGAEGKGIRRLVRENCHVLAKLPCPGSLEHLNVSNAAAVALYEAIRA